MNETFSAWQLMLLTIRSLPVEFWRVVLTIVGSAFSLGNDTHSLFLKGRSMFYGTLFGYLIADVIVEGFTLTGYANLLFLIFGVGGNWIASIVLEAFKEAHANWRTIVPYVWAEVKDSLPTKALLKTGLDYLVTYLKSKVKPS